MSTALAQTAPQFTLPGVDGSDHSLDDYRDAPVLVLVQSCNHCPYVHRVGRPDQRRDARLRRPRRPRGGDHVQRRREPSGGLLRGDARRARAQGFAFDYLYDESQEVAHALGSERTPEVFVYDGDRRLAYHGAVDDNRDETAVTATYLRDALDAVLAGEAPAVADTAPVGCTVKWHS